MTLIPRFLACLIAFYLAGCETLPAVAPTSSQLVKSQDENWQGYVVKVTSLVTRTLSSYRGPTFPSAFRMQQYDPTLALKPGDTVGVTIYETAGSQLFQGTVAPLMMGTPGLAAPQSTSLPLQIIESDGRITIPYVGHVSIAGRTPGQASDLIAQGLSAQTVRPQVIVSLIANAGSNTISVGGDVIKAGLMPLTLRAERLLDVVAWAGGTKYPVVQVDVRLMRGQQVFSVPLQQVMSNPEDNIPVQPNDNVALVYNPKSFVVMGSVKAVNQYAFDYETITVAEGMARAGGGIDTISNLSAVYLFRYEPGPLARTVLTVDSQAVDQRYVAARLDALDGGTSVPVLYRIDMTQADGYFFAQQIKLRDKDVVLMANADTVQFLKFMQVVNSITSAYYNLTRSTNN